MTFGRENGEMLLPKPTKLNMSKGNCLVNAALLRRSLFNKSNGFDEAFQKGLEDYDFWLNMIYPRLKVARDLLTDDGVIFISIDDSEQANLKKICDEVFGESNFIAQFTRKGSGGRQDSKYYAIVHEYLICYAKCIQ